MCSIFQLLPGRMIDHNLLFNAMHNNEHGYGTLIKENGKVHIEKHLPEKVEPDKLFKWLEDNKDVERWVHMRNMSQGTITKENVQPFIVFHSNKRTVVFMHNGTLGSPQYSEAVVEAVQDDIVDGASDSLKYATTRLRPLFARVKGPKGAGDYDDPVVQELIDMGWPYGGGRAILVSSDQDPFTIGKEKWILKKNKDGSEFLTANDDYFDVLKRGKLFDQRKKEAEEAKKKAAPFPVATGDTPYGVSLLLTDPWDQPTDLTTYMANLLDEVDLSNPDELALLANLTEEECTEIFRQSPKDGGILLGNTFKALRDMIFEVDKKQNALVHMGQRLARLNSRTRAEVTKDVDA